MASTLVPALIVQLFRFPVLQYVHACARDIVVDYGGCVQVPRPVIRPFRCAVLLPLAWRAYLALLTTIRHYVLS